MPINDTCGPLFMTSSPSAALQSSLESRLKALTDVNGSPEYALIWKQWDMPAGLPICALRASARRKSDSGFIGWPTPTVPTKTDGHQAGNNRFTTKTTDILKGWAAPKASNGTGAGQRGRGGQNLQTQVLKLKGWASPRANKWGNSDSHGNYQTPLNARMAGAVLSPEHSRWLMGYPVAWTKSADMATPSSRKSPRNSSSQQKQQSRSKSDE
jgi:hypothetical protein